MNRFQRALTFYHPVVNLLLAGTVFVVLTQSMSMPFLAILLSNTTSLTPAEIGMVIGAGPLAGIIGGFVGGILSDLFGRRNLMILSMVMMAAAFVGFVATVKPLYLLLNSILLGLASAFYNTISKALTGDLTPEDKRFRVFANRYLAINLGFSVGPMLGAFLGIAGSTYTFWLTSGTYLLFAGIIGYFCHKYQVGGAPEHTEGKPKLSETFHVLSRDVVLFMFVIGSVLVMSVFSQIFIILPQYINSNFVDGVALYSVLLTTNGLTVLALQIPLTRLAERFSLFRRIIAGVVLVAVGEVGFAFSFDWSWFIFSMVILTLGEILIIPAEFALIDQISPDHIRGTYYGAQSFADSGRFFGPWIGGLVLAHYGGTMMFMTAAGIALFSLVFFASGQYLFQKRKTGRAVTAPPV